VKFNELVFKKGSIPIIEGQPEGDSFFIIKKGQVQQSTSTVALSSEEKQILGPGNFFGVISCMARRPHLHTIDVLEDTLVIVVYREQFDFLIQEITPVAMKILRYFSQKVRDFDAILTRLSLKSSASENTCNLFDIGEYYNAFQGKFNQAASAYLRYLKFCPDGENIGIARTKLAKIYSVFKDKLNLEPKKENYYYNFDNEQVIFLEHEPGSLLYIIQEGEVKISKIVNNQEVLLGILKAGDIFGEMAILENRPRNATAVASGKVRLMAVSKESFPAIVSKHTQIANRIITLLSERIWFLHRHITNMTITDPEIRLFDALYIQALKARAPIAPKSEFTFDLTFEDLLFFSGLKTEKGYTHLRNIIDNRKILKIENGKIVCTDLAQLAGFANVVKRNLEQQKLKDS
jgi:CRP-like cAMP-binding protein